MAIELIVAGVADADRIFGLLQDHHPVSRAATANDCKKMEEEHGQYQVGVSLLALPSWQVNRWNETFCFRSYGNDVYDLKW